MALLDFVVTRYARTKGMGAATIRSSAVRLSGQDTITTAENIEDASGDIVLAAGDVFVAHSSAPIRIRFGGVAATATTGHYVPANVLWDCEVEEPGTVSAIEAA